MPSCRSWASAFLMIGAGCWPAPPSSVDYDKGCTAHTDCVLVGRGCNPHCQCEEQALNVDGAARYDADRDAFLCAPYQEPMLCDCVLAQAFCDDGACAACDPLDMGGLVACPEDVDAGA